MPQWMTITDDEDDVLSKIVEDIEKEIEDNPDFEEVVGISTEQLMRHATQAIASHPRDMDLHSAAGLLQLYAMAFVVGVKFGRMNPA